ncbi:MAG: hypothetical protein QF687_00905 [Nitrospinaceae bacterium]|jgi:hypothetical protein|nr:hypothetical protein [Nitrospinota bacterium]MDP6335283.1 hypothetical protein [Nitrospinaceae bacterium]HAX46762.1 hypothetical protein [Nitrospina sp.]MBV52027.1 hypothetical protein [Nitrospinota bacterium]MDP7147304.1 hypothetical protein [Nitrospinaceae bacterium]|tara:strand:- start:42 stop:275 length:234 start_codon:yes stop_codon:yes gene_type:complete
MWQIELRPEIKKELKDPDKYVQGMRWTYNGLTITMVGVGMMFILYFVKPEHVLRPFWIQILGLVVAGRGEWLKFRWK